MRHSTFMIFVVLVIAFSMTACTSMEADAPEDVDEETLGSLTQAITVLGGLDLNQNCRRRHGQAAYAVLLQPVYSPGAAYAWRCRQNGTDHHIDMQLFCRWQYDNSYAAGTYSDYNNAYSWYCYLP